MDFLDFLTFAEKTICWFTATWSSSSAFSGLHNGE